MTPHLTSLGDVEIYHTNQEEGEERK
jgi:hypothetical protein